MICKNARVDGMILVFLGSAVVVLLMGFLLSPRSSGAIEDFIAEYYSAHALMHHLDPYNQDQVLRVYRAEGGERSLALERDREIATRFVYPPSALADIVPFALLKWRAASVLWMLVSSISLIAAACLAWDLTARNAPILGGLFAGFILANSEVLVVLSNPSELSISLCVIAVWCFSRNRLIPIGILVLSLSLLLKPQIGGLIWVYFLLAGGGLSRKRALQTLGVTTALALPFILWVSAVAPHWMQELRGNLVAFAARGGLNDPGPSSPFANQFVDLQVVFSRFRDDPGFYNLASYAVSAPFLIAWAVIAAKARAVPETTQIALAAIAPLSLLPFHHHLYDSKLLLLMIPALGLLWSKRGPIGWTGLVLTSAAFLLTGDLTESLFLRAVDMMRPTPGGREEWLVDALRVFPFPCILLLAGCFYLYVYALFAFAPERLKGKEQTQMQKGRAASSFLRPSGWFTK